MTLRRQALFSGGVRRCSKRKDTDLSGDREDDNDDCARLLPPPSLPALRLLRGLSALAQGVRREGMSFGDGRQQQQQRAVLLRFVASQSAPAAAVGLGRHSFACRNNLSLHRCREGSPRAVAPPPPSSSASRNGRVCHRTENLFRLQRRLPPCSSREAFVPVARPKGEGTQYAARRSTTAMMRSQGSSG